MSGMLPEDFGDVMMPPTAAEMLHTIGVESFYKDATQVAEAQIRSMHQQNKALRAQVRALEGAVDAAIDESRHARTDANEWRRLAYLHGLDTTHEWRKSDFTLRGALAISAHFLNRDAESAIAECCAKLARDLIAERKQKFSGASSTPGESQP